MNSRLHYGKKLSNSMDVEYSRTGFSQDGTDYRRGSKGPKQLLRNVDTDLSNTAKGIRRGKQHVYLDSVRLQHTQVSHGSIYDNQNVGDSDNQGKQPCVFGKYPDDHSSEPSPGEDPPGDDHSKIPEADPEILLQPETRPISHEQLAVEVKGIYAGLVMVEAKCIDIDERQSEAALEKDPSKRPELKNDQWQSLIALHKQVRYIFKPSLVFRD